MSEQKTIAGSTPVDPEYLVNTDNTTVVGNGSIDHPLSVVSSGGGGYENYAIESTTEDATSSSTSFADYPLEIEIQATESPSAWRLGWEVLALGFGTQGEYILTDEDDNVVDGPVRTHNGASINEFETLGGFVRIELADTDPHTYKLRLRALAGGDGGTFATAAKIEAWQVPVT